MKCLYCYNEANGSGIYTKMCKNCEKRYKECVKRVKT